MLEVIRAGPADEQALANLLQLYLYDLTEFGQQAMGGDARFQHAGLEGYLGGDNAAFLARSLGRPAGFALVSQQSALAEGIAGVRSLDHLFVLRGLRRRGLGRILALEVLRAMPGRWEVRQPASNGPAQAFWRKVIGAYTAGRYVELELDDQRWRGPVQTFDNSLLLG